MSIADTAATDERPQVRVDRQHIIKHQGRDYVLFAGLLDAAHRDGLRQISTTLVQIPSMTNDYTAIVFATVATSRGSFTGLGDASPENVNRMMAKSLIRMAETRAKARALRDAINLGEALADDPDDDGPPEPARTTAATSASNRNGLRSVPAPAPEPEPDDDDPERWPAKPAGEPHKSRDRQRFEDIYAAAEAANLQKLPIMAADAQDEHYRDAGLDLWNRLSSVQKADLNAKWGRTK